MKLSKTTTIALTSASAIIYGFGVFAVRASAQEANILSADVSQQIQSALGAGDNDEILVDALSQVEAQLREYNVSTFALTESDTSDVSELKNLRRNYIHQLRQRLQALSPEEKQEFLSKIRKRRVQVRQELVGIRRDFKAERQAAKQEKMQASQQELTQRREMFKENLQARQQAALERQKTAQEKFQDRLESKAEQMKELNNRSEAKKARDTIKKEKKRDQVEGAIDYQPGNFLEKIGYWISSL